MGDRRSTPVQQALDKIEKLDTDDQQLVIEIVRQRLIERRRAEMSRHARETLQAFREGKARYGSVEELRRDVLEDS